MKKTRMTRFLTVLLACMMLVSLFAACQKKDPADGTTPSTNPTPDVSTPVEVLDYTYNDYLAGGPTTWSAHEWETNTDSYILNLTTNGYYDLILNETKDGYTFFPELASEFPVDVTSEYAGNAAYGVPAGATEGYAFKIKLNELAQWEDGTPINADTHIYSTQQLLNWEMNNYRASTLYTGTFKIANAEAYAKQQTEGYFDVTDSDGNYTDVPDAEKFFSLTATTFFFGNSAQAYYDGGYADYFKDADGNDLYAKYIDGDEYQALTDESKADLNIIAANFGDARDEAYNEFCFYYTTTPAVDWENVGLVKDGEYEITFILAQPITDFYLKYNLSGGWLVHEETYEAGKSEYGGLIKTTYGTSAENYISYGPYKLVEFQKDKSIVLEKNENWWGYSDGNHEGQFQTTRINCQIVEEQATALMMFLQGNLDNIALVAENMTDYRTSDYIVYTPQSYTTKLTFNSDYDALKSRETSGVNRTILSYTDFRHAFSLAIDRTDFAAQCTATHSAGYGLFNYNYVYDPDTGALYRDSDAGKNTLTTLYNVSDESQITGYDVDAAKALFQKAYDEALAAGHISATDKVELEFLTYTSDESYVKIVNFIQGSINAATTGTDLEGRVNLKMTPDPEYYDHAQAGQFEIILSTWGGAAMDPYSILECYCDPDVMFEYGFEPTVQTLTLTVEGQEYTYTYYEWYQEVCNGTWATADSDVRLNILAGVELGVLQNYNCTPLYYRTDASLQSRKVVMGTDTYVQNVEFGGFRFMTYLYDDVAWTDYCKENNNQLTY